jgi:cytochrome c5
MVILLGVICHVIIGVAQNPCNLIIEAVTIIIKCTMSLHLQRNSDGSETYDAKQQDVLKQLPSSLYVALNRFHIDGKTTMYAVCPSCHHTHKPLNPDAAIAEYPERCVNRIVGRDGISDCSTELLAMRNGKLRPIRTFLCPSFIDHVAMLLADPDIEDMLDKACDDAWAAHGNPPPPFATNIFQADFMQEFEGPIAGRLFIDRGDRMRIPFAIHMDFFGPNGVTVRGNSDKLGILSAAVLGLPETKRYKSEYIYTSTISRPDGPKLEQANPYLKPIIDDAVTAWERGIRISSTGASPRGRDVDLAFVLSVNDLPAARQVAGLAHHSSHFFCSVCNCKGIPTMYRTDFDHPDWKPRDVSLLRQKAEAWRDATTLGERDAIFAEYGVRWSEFWRLPYWNPSRMLVIDSMHCILEGIVHYHCRHVLEIDAEKAKTTEKTGPAFSCNWPPYDEAKVRNHPKCVCTEKEQAQLCALQKDLELSFGCAGGLSENQLSRKLGKANNPALRYLCRSLHLALDPKAEKKDLVARLIEWVSATDQFTRIC